MSRNRVQTALLSVLIIVMGVMNVISLQAQSQPSAEIFVDTSSIYYPLRLTIATNTRKDIASMTVRATDPTNIVAFDADTNKYFLYPIGETGMGISTVPDSNFLPTGGNITVARFMTDNTTRQQKFTVDFLNRNGESVASQTINVGIGSTVVLAPPCDRQRLDLTTGLNTSGNLIPVGGIDQSWSVCGTSTPAYAITPHPFWNTSGISRYLGINTSIYGQAPQGDYTFCRTICSQDKRDATIQLKLLADDNVDIQFQNANGTITYYTSYGNFSNANNWVGFQVLLTPGQNFLIIKVHNIPAWVSPMGFMLLPGSQIYPFNNAPVLGLAGSSCCRPTSIIKGIKYWDKNCDGKVTNGDSGLPGWTISATPTTGGPAITAVTDAGGAYSIPVYPGTYTVSESLTGQTGWSPSTSAGPYTVTVGMNQTVNRDFLNCKQPTCEELFTVGQSDSVCCTGRFSLSNAGNSVVTSLSFSVTGGVLTGVNTGCMATTSPNMTTGLSSGIFNFIPGCANMAVEFDAKSTTATGKVCVLWTATFKQGTKTFTCTKEICLNCIRMPKDCRVPLQVTPDAFPPINTDSRTFTINNVKLPASQISSVEVLFVNEPTPPHIGGGLLVDGPPTRNWTYANSSAYNKINLNCSGGVTPTYPQGTAANNWVKFNLGVDNTINYSGLILIKIGYCDGDTCLTEYQWNGKKINSIPSSIDTAIAIKNPRILRFKVISPDSTRSTGIRVGDSLVTILAVTAPCGSLENDCPDITKQFRAATKGNIAHITFGDGGCNPDPYCYCCPPDSYTLTVVYTPGTDKVDPKVPLKLSFFDKNGVEIGQAEKILTSSVVSNVNSTVAPIPVGDVVINSVTPNPASGTVTFNYTLGTSETVRLELFNPLGQSVVIISDGFQTQGTHRVNYQVDSLESGTYYLRLTTLVGKASAVVKVVH